MEGNMDTLKLFGKRLRSLRRARNLTQEQLGELAGLNYKYLGAIERGEENPSLKVIEKIADALGLELIDLFRFSHETANVKEAKAKIRKVLETDDLEKLQITLRLLEAIFRGI
jgi:transcriptional regulator with XRE-family HTH domain